MGVLLIVVNCSAVTSLVSPHQALALTNKTPIVINRKLSFWLLVIMGVLLIVVNCSAVTSLVSPHQALE
jgi:uncharacterized protein YceK